MSITYDARTMKTEKLMELTNRLFELYEIKTRQNLIVKDYPLSNAVEIFPAAGEIEEVRYRNPKKMGGLMVGAKDRVSFELRGILYIVNYYPERA
jgi:methyl coenzyme M reductase subunit D